jgi:NAD(P)-dependent dehydrogenase (short-subunit alcohol dehydrogenase family)
VLFTFELARRLNGLQVTANALHPGFVATRFGHNNQWLFNLGMRLAHLFALSPEQGAQTIIYLASSPQVEGVSGQYFVKKRSVRADPAVYDLETAQNLWRISAEMVGVKSNA